MRPPTTPMSSVSWTSTRRFAWRAERLAAGESDVEQLHALGDLLNGHVRHEERTLFPRIEAALDPAELAALGAALIDAEGGAHRPPRC